MPTSYSLLLTSYFAVKQNFLAQCARILLLRSYRINLRLLFTDSQIGLDGLLLFKQDAEQVLEIVQTVDWVGQETG